MKRAMKTRCNISTIVGALCLLLINIDARARNHVSLLVGHADCQMHGLIGAGGDVPAGGKQKQQRQ